jgi:hypothetical protein
MSQQCAGVTGVTCMRRARHTTGNCASPLMKSNLLTKSGRSCGYYKISVSLRPPILDRSVMTPHSESKNIEIQITNLTQRNTFIGRKIECTALVIGFRLCINHHCHPPRIKSAPVKLSLLQSSSKSIGSECFVLGVGAKGVGVAVAVMG